MKESQSQYDDELAKVIQMSKEGGVVPGTEGTIDWVDDADLKEVMARSKDFDSLTPYLLLPSL